MFVGARGSAALKAGGEKHGPQAHRTTDARGRTVGQPAGRRSGRATTRRDKESQTRPDLVDRNFVAARPNQLGWADITFVPTASALSVLAVVLEPGAASASAGRWKSLRTSW